MIGGFRKFHEVGVDSHFLCFFLSYENAQLSGFHCFKSLFYKIKTVLWFQYLYLVSQQSQSDWMNTLLTTDTYYFAYFRLTFADIRFQNGGVQDTYLNACATKRWCHILLLQRKKHDPIAYSLTSLEV